MKLPNPNKGILICGLMLLCQPALASSEKLLVNPKKFLTLKQDNICTMSENLSWQNTALRHYCLYLDNRQKPLQHWKNSRKGVFDFEFSETETTSLY